MSYGSQKSSSSNSNAHSSVGTFFLQAGGTQGKRVLLSKTRQQDSSCLSPGVEQANVKLPTETSSSSDFEAQPWEVAQMKVSESASPAWEAELGGGVNAFFPSARALKC